MISTLRLQNFRSYKDESFEFDSGVNIIVGPNASGKTNLLEAILILAGEPSYRAKDVELIRTAAPWAKLDGYFGHVRRVVKIEVRETKTSKTYELDGKPYKRLSLERTVPVVLFEPNHLQLITRGPQQRREYLDDLLQRSIPGFKSLSASYQRTLMQRNTLLKKNPSYAHKQLFAWDVRLSELGAKVSEARQKLVEEINEGISKTYSRIAHRKTSVEIKYESQFPTNSYASKMLSKLQTTTERDFSIGFTSHGPHREDIIISLDGQSVNQTASRGETRSLVLALKIFELGLLEKTRGEKPIFILDDVFSELDGKRRHALVNHLKKHQVIITTTDADAVLAHFSAGRKLIALK